MRVTDHLRRSLLGNVGIRDSAVVNRAYVLYSAAKKLIYWRFGLMKPERLAGMKTSDTLLIVGAGESVNLMTPDQWEEVARYDVAGFSYSCLLPVKHTVYFFESPSNARLIQQHVTKLLPIIREGRANGRLERVIWKNPVTREAERLCQLQDFERMGSVNLLSGKETVVAALTSSALRHGMFRRILLQYRGSAFAIAWLAGLLGYQHVVFCGVDLRGPRYFFETAPEYAKWGLINPLVLENGDGGLPETHPTNDPRSGVPIAAALRVLCTAMVGTRYYVANTESALAEFLPTWQWGIDDLSRVRP